MFSVRTLIMFPRGFEINGITITPKSDKGLYECSISLEAGTAKEARERARTKVNYIFQAVGLLYNSPYEMTVISCERGLPGGGKRVQGYFPVSFEAVLKLEPAMRKKVSRLLENVHKTNDTVRSALSFYNEGVQLGQWLSQAYLWGLRAQGMETVIYPPAVTKPI